ncbi:MAG: hypothetical protein ACQEWR_08370 [Bacillota bacterium]
MTIVCTDGTKFIGRFKAGQTWIKGRFKRTLLDVSNDRVKYSLINEKERETSLDCFVNWVFSGAKLDVGKRIIPCSNCQKDIEIKKHINKCECGLRVKVLH